MLRAIIVDDEPKSCDTLSTMIAEFVDGVTVVAVENGVQSAIKSINQHKPDIVFLDIEMNSETGFDLLTQMPSIDFEVVFTTAFEQYALKAIKFAALDYLLKPIDIGELEESVEKVKEKRKSKDLNQGLEALMANLKSTSSSQHQIALPSSDGLLFVHVTDIIYCQADGPYTYFYLKDGSKVTVSKNLKEYEELLEDHYFFRVHKSYLINLKEMKRYVKGDGGYVIMSNDKEVDVSKRKKESFMSALATI